MTSSVFVRAMLFLLTPLDFIPRATSETITKTSSCPSRCSCDPLPLKTTVADSFGSDIITVDCAGRRSTSDVESVEFIVADDFANVTVDLDLSRNGLNLLPLGSLGSLSTSASAKFNNLRHVDLSSNDFQVITSGSLSEFIGTHAGPRSLSLADNEIVQIGVRSFSGLKDLQYLTLSGNRLTGIEANSFVGLSRVERLELNRNQLELLPPLAFVCLRSLRNVTLSHNKISSVGRDAFSRHPTQIVSGFNHDEKHIVGHLPPATAAYNSIRYLLVDVAQKSVSATDECIENANPASSIQFIDLSYNRLRSMPEWGAVGESLVEVALDGNPIRRIGRWSFRSMPNLANVSLSSMPDLVAVDRFAFVDVPSLVRLQLNDNRRLGFVDPEAFDFRSVVSLLFVSLHGNALQTVPDSLLSWSSTMHRNSTGTRLIMRIGGNPFHCDCNVRWICATLASSSSVPADIGGVLVITDGEDIRCDSPTAVSGTLLSELRPEFLSTDRCPPVIIPFFDAVIHVVVGTESMISLDCRAIGLPRPRVHWILPNGRVINASTSTSPLASSSRRERIDVDPTGTLYISGFRFPDRGTYTCVAMNERGYDAAATTLRPVMTSMTSNSTSSSDQSRNSSSACSWSSTGPRLFVKSVSSTFVAVSWSTVDPFQGIVTPPPAAEGVQTSRPFGYSIVYREFDSTSGSGRQSTVSKQNPPFVAVNNVDALDVNDKDVDDDDDNGANDDGRMYIARVPLRPSMRAFTVTNLRPLTTYEFCISCEPTSTATQSPPVHGYHNLPPSPLTVGRRRQNHQPWLFPGAASRDSCIRVRTTDRRNSAVVANINNGYGRGYEYKMSGQSVEATAAGVVRTVFGATVISSVVAVLSLCGLLVCIRRIRTRYRRHAYSNPVGGVSCGGRRGDGNINIHDRDERLRKLCSDVRYEDHVAAARRNGGGSRRGIFGGRSVTLIPMSNLTELPSTNLTSSRTSLLQAM